MDCAVMRCLTTDAKLQVCAQRDHSSRCRVFDAIGSFHLVSAFHIRLLCYMRERSFVEKDSFGGPSHPLMCLDITTQPIFSWTCSKRHVGRPQLMLNVSKFASANQSGRITRGGGAAPHQSQLKVDSLAR